MTKPFKTTGIVFVLSIIIVLTTGLGYGYISYMLRSIQKETVLLSEETRALELDEAQISTIRSNVAATQENRQTLGSYFIDQENIVPFLETIELYATDAGVRMTFNAVEWQKDPVSLRISVLGSGSFLGAYRFVKLIENAPYEMTIDSVDVRRSVPVGFIPLEGQGTGTWEARVILRVLSVNTE